MKIKIFAVCLAVMCLMSCMCVTAFAADIYVQNGVEFTGSYYSDSDWTVLKVEPDVTYTITTDADISELNVVYCYDGYIGNRTLKFVDGVCEYTCDDASMTGIALHSPTGGDAITFTVTWPQPPAPPEPSAMESFITGIRDTSTALWNAAGDAVEFVMTTPLAQVGVIIGILSVGVILAKKYLFAH